MVRKIHFPPYPAIHISLWYLLAVLNRFFGLTQTNVELARSYLALGERLKFTEQKLNYLKRCKSYNVYPVFILNGVKVNLNLFGGRKSRYIYNLEDKLRSSSLRYHIRNSYDEIRNIKQQLHNTKQHLYLNISDQFLIHEILRTAEDYNFYIRTHHKCRLQKKFNWLLYKYYNIASNFHDRIQPLSSIIYIHIYIHIYTHIYIYVVHGS